MPELDKTKRMDLAGTQALVQDSLRRFKREITDPILGPTYDEDDECIEFPITSAASYDAEDECVEIG